MEICMTSRQEIYIASGLCSLSIALFFLLKSYTFNKKPNIFIQDPQKNLNNSTENHIENIPPEIQKNIFKFFNRRALLEISTVSKEFHGLSIVCIDELRKECEKNIFYTIGNHVHACDFKLLDMTVLPISREVSFSEIYNSFCGKKLEIVHLFKTKKEASDYSVCLRRRKDDSIGEAPPVFEVIFLDNTELLKEEKQTIDVNHRVDNNSFTFAKAKRESVIPLQAFMNDKAYSCKDWQENPSSFKKNTCTIF